MPQDDRVHARRTILRSAAALGGLALLRTSAGAFETPSRLVDRMAVPPTPASLPPAPAAATQVAPAQVALAAPTAPKGVRPALFARAKEALDRHGSRFARRDLIALADFTDPSSDPRFQFIHLESGTVTTMRVTHGSGSDPAHSGMLHKFSNTPSSNSTSEGAYLSSDYYIGKHGRSQRLVGLDPTNDNALARAIVVHGAWYANPDVLASLGKLGRSQGCFATAEKDLPRVFALLGEQRLLYAGRA